MKARFYCTFLFILFIINTLSAQKVGLVMSGGGAKGLAHIGVIKALEENSIPIDYVAGTSMGAVVGSLYAMGYTVEDMIALFKSDEFKQWSSGEMSTRQKYFFRQSDPKPSFVDLYFEVKNKEFFRIKSKFIPVNLISPLQMNYAFLELFTQATASSGSDFNRLFVPFRCVAADIYEKESVTLCKGDLGDAVRASMTFPFMYKPIKIDEKLLFDGGIFNNFPVDVMQKEFRPDFIVGSVVARYRQKPSEDDVLSHLRNMIMSRTDYDVEKEKGELIRCNLSSFGEFDFGNIDELVKIGYEQTLPKIDSIKARVKRETPADTVNARRKNYLARLPRLRFNGVEVNGVNPYQQEYVRRIFQKADDEVFGMSELRNGYFRLVNDEKISEVQPHAVYNAETGYFTLHLDVKIQHQLKLQFGGNVSSATSNQAYAALNYQTLKKNAYNAHFDIHFGRMYNALGAGLRVDFPWQSTPYVKWTSTLHSFDYFKPGAPLFSTNSSALFNQSEFYTKLSIGIPLTYRHRLEIGAGFGLLRDRYFDENDILAQLTNDYENAYQPAQTRSVCRVSSFFGKFETFSLNNVMYPTEGYKAYATAQFNVGDEHSARKHTKIDWGKNTSAGWLQAGFSAESYLPLAKHFTLGYLAQGRFSTRPLAQNYTASVMQMSAFAPTPHSQTVFEPLYRSHTYAAAGVKPMLIFNKQWHLRGECYAFAPYKTLELTDEGPAYNHTQIPFSQVEWLGECSLVYNFKIATVSAFANYYSGSISPFNVGVNIGFLLFNKRFLE